MISVHEWKKVALASVGILLVLNIPYLLAYAVPPPYVFGGILFNIEDGYSYLAKMREGWRGEWLFTLPYTAEPGAGIFIYTYHLFLGHVARWLGLSLDVIYHAARLLSGFTLLLTAYRLVAHFMEQPHERLLTWLFFVFSSGLGWLAAFAFPSNIPPYDLWVTESIPLLTLFNNAHFPLAWALLLLIVHWTILDTRRPRWLRMFFTVLAVMALAMTQPMTLVLACAIVGVVCAWRAFLKRKLTWAEIVPVGVVGLSAGPWALFIAEAVNATPALQAWTAQNNTLSPSLIPALLWGGVPFGLAIIGAWLVRHRPGLHRDVLAVWLVMGVVLMYLPFAFQRRMSLGLWFPIALLATITLQEVILPRINGRWRPAALGTIVAASVLSNLLPILASTGLALTRSATTFWTQAELAAVRHLPANALVLAAPQTGTLLPTQADVRVLYGHPMETVNGETQRQRVTAFFTGGLPAAEFLRVNNIEVIFYGLREAALGPLPSLPPEWRIIFQQETVTVYARQ